MSPPDEGDWIQSAITRLEKELDVAFKRIYDLETSVNKFIGALGSFKWLIGVLVVLVVGTVPIILYLLTNQATTVTANGNLESQFMELQDTMWKLLDRGYNIGANN